jgi:hypothetical protein
MTLLTKTSIWYGEEKQMQKTFQLKEEQPGRVISRRQYSNSG